MSSSVVFLPLSTSLTASFYAMMRDSLRERGNEMRRIEARRAERLGRQDAGNLGDGLLEVVVDDHVVVVLGGGQLEARVGQALGLALLRVAPVRGARLQRVERGGQ